MNVQCNDYSTVSSITIFRAWTNERKYIGLFFGLKVSQNMKCKNSRKNSLEEPKSNEKLEELMFLNESLYYQTFELLLLQRRRDISWSFFSQRGLFESVCCFKVERSSSESITFLATYA
jgi:hypothetical protein